jgi:hypothetical protein
VSGYTHIYKSTLSIFVLEEGVVSGSLDAAEAISEELLAKLL